MMAGLGTIKILSSGVCGAVDGIVNDMDGTVIIRIIYNQWCNKYYQILYHMYM